MALSALKPHHPHPPSSPPLCKFWLQGGCARANSCRFSHASPVPPPAAKGKLPYAAPQRPPSAYSWRRPASAQASPAVLTPSVEEEKVKEAAAEEVEEGEVEPSTMISISSSSFGEVSVVQPGPTAIAPAATATGVSAFVWPILAVTREDGSVWVDDAEEPGRRRCHKLPSPITCMVDGPVQQLLHPGLVFCGLASGDIAAMACKKHDGDLVHIIPGPPQSCGKALCLVSARTPNHSRLLLLVGYENGAILCWEADLDSLTFSPLRTLQYPGAPSIVSMDISEDFDDGAFGGQQDSEKKLHLLYSGSADGSISVWDLDSFCRLQVVQCGAPVTKLLCWGRHLLSGSSDGTIKAWRPRPSEAQVSGMELELLYTQPSPRQTAKAVVDLCGQRMEFGCLLFAAYSDNTVSILELPSFRDVTVMSMSWGVTAMDVAYTRPQHGHGQPVLLLAGEAGSALCFPIQPLLQASS